MGRRTMRVERDRSIALEVKARGKAQRRADMRALTRDPYRWDDMADVAHDMPRVGKAW